MIRIRKDDGMEDKGTRSGYQASGDDGKGAFKTFCGEHPIAAAFCVFTLLCVFGSAIKGFVLYVLFVIAAIAFSAIAAFIIYYFARMIYHAIMSMHESDTTADVDDRGGKASKSRVRKAERELDIPDALKDMVRAGAPEAISISEDYSKMLQAAEDAGENRSMVAASYSVTLDNAAKIISAYKDLCSHPSDFNDPDSVKSEYLDTMQSLHEGMLAKTRSFNDGKLERMREDMKTVKTTASQD